MANDTPTQDPGPQSTAAGGAPLPDHAPVTVTEAPPERVGLLLAEARTSRGLGLEEVSDQLDGQLDATSLMALESGAIEVDVEVFEALGRIYGVGATDLVPPRNQLIIDLSEGYLRAGPDIALLNDGTGRGEVLNSYLEMVWELRELEPGTVIPLRGADLVALSSQFGVEPAELESDLRRLMADSRTAGRTRVLVGLGTALALITGGVLLWQNSADTAPTGEPTAVTSVIEVPEQLSPLPPAPTADVGDAAVLERGGVQGAPGQDPRTLPPVPTAEIGDAATLERDANTPRTDLESLLPAPTAEVGDAVVVERNPDGTPGPQQTR